MSQTKKRLIIKGKAYERRNKGEDRLESPIQRNSVRITHITGSCILKHPEPLRDAFLILMMTRGQWLSATTRTPVHQILVLATMDPLHSPSSHHEKADLFQPGMGQWEAQAGEPSEETSALTLTQVSARWLCFSTKDLVPVSWPFPTAAP